EQARPADHGHAAHREGLMVPQRRALRSVRAVACMLAAATLLAACDGSNLFEGNVAEDPPRITAISAPAEVTTPDTFDIDIFASAPRGVALVEVEFSGAFVLADEFDFKGTKTVEIVNHNVTLDQA